MLNKCMLIGNLGRDPETKHSANGTTIANFSIATSEKYNGETKTEWHNIVAFNKLAEIVEKYLAKGSMVCIIGKITTRKWQDKTGADRYTTEIIASEMKMIGGRIDKSHSSSDEKNADMADAPGTTSNDFDDDIPF